MRPQTISAKGPALSKSGPGRVRSATPRRRGNLQRIRNEDGPNRGRGYRASGTGTGAGGQRSQMRSGSHVSSRSPRRQCLREREEPPEASLDRSRAERLGLLGGWLRQRHKPFPLSRRRCAGNRANGRHQPRPSCHRSNRAPDRSPVPPGHAATRSGPGIVVKFDNDLELVAEPARTRGTSLGPARTNKRVHTVSRKCRRADPDTASPRTCSTQSTYL